jgi:hypothetical protein
MPSDAAVFSLSKKWKVARLTSEISSSLKGIGCNAVTGVSTAASAPVATRETPAAPKTDTAKAFLDFLHLQEFFVCDMDSLLLPPSNQKQLARFAGLEQGTSQIV